MDRPTTIHIQSLRQAIEKTEAQLTDLKRQLEQALGRRRAQDIQKLELCNTDQKPAQQNGLANESALGVESRWPLADDEYKRYGRQLIMPEIGLPGQLRLRKAKVLVIGIGGLGCPAAAYLAGAGVGTLGLMDGDEVELSNLHRQILHSESSIATSKVDSALAFLSARNSNVRFNRHPFHLKAELACAIFRAYDLILDCTDHPTSRYLISDACVLTGRPLVSASALRTEGQLMVLNNPPRSVGDMSSGPCYRCVFPKPPPAESVLSCGEGGILGPVVGVMGILQALTAIKVLTLSHDNGVGDGTDHLNDGQYAQPTLLMFSAYNQPQFRSVRLRSRRKDCAACSAKATITEASLENGSLDYVAFCGASAPVQPLQDLRRVSAQDYVDQSQNGASVLIDVRDKTQYGICAVPGSINIPWTGNVESWLATVRERGLMDPDGRTKYTICRFGNDSQLAAGAMIDHMETLGDTIKEIRGGFRTWRDEVDPRWPDY